MKNNEAVRQATKGVVDLHHNRFNYLKAVDNPKVGYVSIYTPEEIFLAAGVIPFRITGEEGSNTMEANAILGNNYCSYILSCLSEGLSGVYDFADGIIFVDACDMRKRLWETWKRDVKSNTSYFLEFPNNSSDTSKEYFAGQLRKLVKTLEREYDCEITDAALRKSIETCNTSRALMQRLYRYKQGKHQALTGNESIEIIKAASTGLKEDFNANMLILLDTLENTTPPDTHSNNHRVLICGSYFDHSEVVEIVENAGADLVCEDLSNGVKYFEGNIDLDRDPVDAIADYYLEKNTSSCRLDPDARVEHLLNLVKEHNVDSVVYYVLKFCDTNLHDYPYIKDKLKREKIPVIFIEGERNATNFAGIKTRIQTFLEARMF